MTPLRRYYRGHSLVAMRDVQANQTRYYHFDNQGTTQALTDSSGAVTDRFASDAWGVQVKRTGSSINREWYIGNLGYIRQVDQALDYVRARYYATAHARWESADPLPVGDPLYAYAAGTPVAYLDPSGLVVCEKPECVAEGLLRTSCPKPCNHDERGRVVYPPPNPTFSQVTEQLQRIYKICKVDYDRSQDAPWGFGQALTKCCEEVWCRRKCLPEEWDGTLDEKAQLRTCHHPRGCIEIYRYPHHVTGWDWLPAAWQYCLWQHESRRAKICQCTLLETNGGGVPDAEKDRMLDCVGRILRRYNKDVKWCTPPPPGKVIPFDPKPPDCLRTWHG